VGALNSQLTKIGKKKKPNMYTVEKDKGPKQSSEKKKKKKVKQKIKENANHCPWGIG